MTNVFELVAALEDVLHQACASGDTLDSCAHTAYADAMRLLAELGRLEITVDVGRRVIGRWVEP